ncbi:MAG: dTDP-4-dehydrorhamnose 3,5-epimerase family protein [Terriglobales bacterium]
MSAHPLPGPGTPLALAVAPAPGRGALIASPDDPALIAGVEIVAALLWPDDRGRFTELFRFDRAEAAGWARGFHPRAQISASFSYPGVIKAVHYHRRQTDLWAPLRGELQIALFDLRLQSPTFGALNTVFAGESRPWRLRIPPGVGHGYKVLGAEPGLIIYAADGFYDPADQGRIAHDDAALNYDWQLRHG